MGELGTTARKALAVNEEIQSRVDKEKRFLEGTALLSLAEKKLSQSDIKDTEWWSEFKELSEDFKDKYTGGELAQGIISRLSGKMEKATRGKLQEVL